MDYDPPITMAFIGEHPYLEFLATRVLANEEKELSVNRIRFRRSFQYFTNVRGADAMPPRRPSHVERAKVHLSSMYYTTDITPSKFRGQDRFCALVEGRLSRPRLTGDYSL